MREEGCPQLMSNSWGKLNLRNRGSGQIDEKESLERERERDREGESGKSEV